MSWRRLVIAVCVASLVLAVSASGALRWHVISSQRSSGVSAAAVAGVVHAKNPHAVAIRILASPNQRVTGTWSNECSKGSRTGAFSGELAGRTPLLHVLRMPMSHPDLCYVAGSGQLSGSGSIRVQILKR